MRALILFLHFYSAIFLGGGILLGIAAHFESEWSEAVKKYHAIWKKLALGWGLVLISLLTIARPFYDFPHFSGYKAVFFSTYFLVGRNLFYALAAWGSLKVLSKWPSLSLILFFIVGNLFAFDWAMSLEKSWFSNIYGLIYLGNGVSGAMAVMILLDFDDLHEKVKTDLYHLLLVTCIFGFYLHFSQFIIMWMGNLPREVIFYTERNVWLIALVFVLKLLPVGLVSFVSHLKKKPFTVKSICCLILVSYALEILWVVNP